MIATNFTFLAAREMSDRAGMTFSLHQINCEEWSFLFKESRFLTIGFLAGANLLPHPRFRANPRTRKLRKLQPVIKGADHREFFAIFPKSLKFNSPEHAN